MSKRPRGTLFIVCYLTIQKKTDTICYKQNESNLKYSKSVNLLSFIKILKDITKIFILSVYRRFIQKSIHTVLTNSKVCVSFSCFHDFLKKFKKSIAEDPVSCIGYFISEVIRTGNERLYDIFYINDTLLANEASRISYKIIAIEPLPQSFF